MSVATRSTIIHTAILAASVLACGDAASAHDDPVGPPGSVAFHLPDDPTTRDRAERSAAWIRRHVARVAHPDAESPIPVVAWHDPTLHAGRPNRRVGYLITDALWSAKALRPFDPDLAEEIEAGLERLGWSRNGLQDVLFHPVARPLHRSDDADPVHGHPLGRFPTADGESIELRVMRQRWDADFEKGHPRLFAEHAVYQALYDFWAGRRDDAARRILGVIRDDRKADPGDSIFWDDDAGVLVDHVHLSRWLRFREGGAETCPHHSFKLGVLLYAVRLMGLEAEVGPPLKNMKRRLWSAQREDGGVVHFLNVPHQGKPLSQLVQGATGESTAIAVLSETVAPAD